MKEEIFKRYYSIGFNCTLALILSSSLLFADLSKIEFTSSNLPIIVINTHGQSIPTSNPRIVADMGIIYNGEGARNNLTDSFNNYDGKISIEIRGSSSAGWLKKSYNIETQNAGGTNLNVPLLNMPEENDWVLNGPYYDRSFIRNVLTFELVRRMGWYSSRTRCCELVLNGEYQGIYILEEKIKRDKNRVDISTLNPDEISGDDVTGGYIIKIDKEPWKPGFDSKYPPRPGSNRIIRYQFHDPDGDDIVPEQEAYIQGFVNEFEDVMFSSNYTHLEDGYSKYINIESFVDNFLINEISRNVDGYRLSTYFHKDKDSNDGKLTAGPAWDFNFSFGNVGYYDAEKLYGWQIDYFNENVSFHSRDGSQAPFWWAKLLDDPNFKNKIYYRWQELRQTILHFDSLYNYIDDLRDYLDEAQSRNFEIWIGPGDPKADGDGWFPPDYPIRDLEIYDDEIEYLKTWMTSRMNWMDSEINSYVSLEEKSFYLSEIFKIERVYPNPFNSSTKIEFRIEQSQVVNIILYDMRGREISTILNRRMSAGQHSVIFNLQDLASGVYLLRLIGKIQTDHHKIILIK